MYLNVKVKFSLSLTLSAIWTLTSIYLAIPWYTDLTALMYHPIPEFIILGLAIIPGWGMSFMISALIMDQRPLYGDTPFRAVPFLV